MRKIDKSLWIYGVVALCWSTAVFAQQGVEVSIAGITGANTVNSGAEVLIYGVQVRDTVNDARVARMGGVPVIGEGILITISDLTVATGVAAADFTGLNLYRSTDAIFDGGDIFLKAVAPVVIGAITVVDFQGVGNPDRTMPDPGDVPDRIFFLITADIAAGATVGHTFRLGAAINHIDVRDSGGGPPTSYNIGSAIVAADADHVVIQAAGGGSSSSAGSSSGSSADAVSSAANIPFGGEWLFALVGLAYGVYVLCRRQ